MLCLVSESKVCRYPCSLHQPRHRNQGQHPLLEQQAHCSLGSLHKLRTETVLELYMFTLLFSVI